MHTRLLLIGTLLTAPAFALAQEAAPTTQALQAPTAMVAEPAAPAVAPLTDNAQLDEALRGLQNEWAVIKYQEPNEDAQLAKMKTLADKAAGVSAQYPSYAEPKIWQAIILSTQAGMDGGLGAMSIAEKAKGLLEQAIKINDKALEGSAYTSLGTLYYKAPAWPIGFGDNGKARAYLEQARAINPNGIDTNYFYGDFLIEANHAKEAIPVLEHALQAAPRPGRELADEGRRKEINQALLKAREEASE